MMKNLETTGESKREFPVISGKSVRMLVNSETSLIKRGVAQFANLKIAEAKMPVDESIMRRLRSSTDSP